MATEPTPASELDHRLRDLAPGWHFAGRYRMDNLIGRGAMGVVWRAQDERLERTVALKFLVETLVHDPMAIDDLKRETRRALELTHHNIVRVYDFVEDPGQHLSGIAMEFFPGKTLSALRIEQPTRCFSPETIAPWIAQLFSAMAYAHEKVGVIHRDLKPQNLMLDDRGELKITDFGIARVASDSLTRVTIGKVSGTPSYMSPQQARGEAPAPSDDIYAIGATLYELLTSRPPFWQGNVPLQLAEVKPPSVADRRRELTGIEGELPVLWEEMIAACLAKDPRGRPRSVRELADVLGISLAFHDATPTVQSAVPATPSPVPTAMRAASMDDDFEAPTIVGAPLLPREEVAPPPAPVKASPAKPQRKPIAVAAAVLAGLIVLGSVILFRPRTTTENPPPTPPTLRSVPSIPSATTVPPTAGARTLHIPDDFATIQAAIDSSSPGDQLVLRPGTYRESVTLKETVRLSGESAEGCILEPPAGAAAITIRDIRRAAIENLTINAAQVTDGIVISNSEVSVVGCVVRGAKACGIRFAEGASGIAESNLCERNGDAGILVTGNGTSPTLRTNRCIANVKEGISFSESARGLAENNTCRGNGGNGIEVGGRSAPTLNGNTCQTNGIHGISIGGASRGAVANNICEENSDSGLAAFNEGTSPNFIKNTSRKNAHYGIYFGTGADGDATGNLCEENLLSGIRTANLSTRPTISANRLIRNQKYGIEVTDGAAPKIPADNEITGNVMGTVSK